MDKKFIGAFVVGVVIIFLGYKMIYHKPNSHPPAAAVAAAPAPNIAITASHNAADQSGNKTSAAISDGTASDLTDLAAKPVSQAEAAAALAAINPEAVPIKDSVAPAASPATVTPAATAAATTPTTTAPNVAATTPAAPEVITKDYRQDPANGLSDSELVTLYTDQIAKNPKDGNSYYQRALIYQKVKQYNAAIVDYSKALGLTKESANAYFNRGLCYEKRLEHDDAISDYNNALQIKDDDPRIYNARGLSYVEKENLKAAEQDYITALKLDPNYDQAYFNLGTLYERQKKYKDALDAYSRAIQFNRPDKDQMLQDQTERKLEAYYRRAIMYLDLNQTDAALKDANYVIAQDPNNAKAYRVRAAIYTKAGNPGAAASDEVTAQNLGIEGMLQNNK